MAFACGIPVLRVSFDGDRLQLSLLDGIDRELFLQAVLENELIVLDDAFVPEALLVITGPHGILDNRGVYQATDRFGKRIAL